MSNNDLNLGQDATVESNMYWPIWNAQTETNDSGNDNLYLDLPSMDYGPKVGSSFNADIGPSQFVDAVNPGPPAPGQVDAAPGAPSEPELVSAPVINATRPNSELPPGWDSDFTDSLETWSPQRLQQPPIWQDSTLSATSSSSTPFDAWQKSEMAGPSSTAPTLDDHVANAPQAGSSAHLDLAGPSRETAVWQHSTLPANSSSLSAFVTDSQQTEVNYALEGYEFAMPQAGPPAASSLDEANPTQDDSPRPTQPHPAFEFDPESLAGFGTFPSEVVAPTTMDHTPLGFCNHFDWMESSVESNNEVTTTTPFPPEMALPLLSSAQCPQLSQNPQLFLTPQPIVNGVQSFSGSLSGVMAPPTSTANTQLLQRRQLGSQAPKGVHNFVSQLSTYPMEWELQFLSEI
ncbi:hypothetical protein EST38_g14531 [Candolleomyces aberdarensis]|uniref:Uncharacterized protein n=1 Tax=Candolleomyces aberdarensis TaxID=2316362 RepID=A0A4Q2CZF5_9AGAR|nr:hypothetical protein EST38_g14531 [Candolleomyces aberdarensis]